MRATRVVLACAVAVLLATACEPLDAPAGSAAGRSGSEGSTSGEQSSSGATGQTDQTEQTGSPSEVTDAEQATDQDAADPSDVVVPAVVAPPRASAPPKSPSSPLLYAAKGGDGDSWKDRDGREYRLGLINTPELNECYGQAASDRRKQLVRQGFRAKAYATDDFGRSVAVVTLADGTNLNVLLARTGYADDRYLERFRSENPGLARQLDAAFAAAKKERRGLWKACAGGGAAPEPAQQQPVAGNDCHPDYRTCIPVKGDGSGRGAANDLDCGDIGKRVELRQRGMDPYRLDSDGDGIGCDSS